MKKKSPQQYRDRLGLQLICTVLVFSVLLLSVLLTIGIVFVLTRYGLMEDLGVSTEVGLPFFLLLVLISAVVGFILAILAAQFMVRPLNQLITLTDRLASGDFSARLDPGPAAKVHSSLLGVIQSFNALAEQLDKTEIFREDFINNFSHEFKTPIVSIAGFAKLLRKGKLSPEEQQEYLEVIEEESLRLSAMATNMLSLTKVENQAILTGVTTYNLSEQLRDSILLLEPKWEKKHIEFQLEFEEFDVSANEELMKQVFINLVDNAIKFSPENSTVEVNVLRSRSDLSVSVTNVGEPIPEEKQARIFQKFYQADESHASEGNGIGLALAEKIVSLHRGRIFVACREGKTTFTVTLPQ